MTTHYDAGNSRPPARVEFTGNARQLSGVPPQTFPLPPRSVPHQASTSSISTFFTTRDTFGPPAPKRQKTHDGYAYTTSPINSDIKLENLSNLFPDNPLSKVGVVTRSTQTASNKITSATTPLSVPPSPIRPHSSPLRKPGATRLPLGTSVNKEVQTKPYALEITKNAPQYEDLTSTDFFPWLGTHQEDILGEISVKNGFYDRTPATPQECNSGARSTIWTNLKHKSGLQILSSLFVSVLDRRQTSGMVTAKCTFKPPPRVTLTDAKRESWLRDLASPTIPLRRLSRTIPHGIRGKSLLDHCLAKNIPVWRAVWLAKCVGANEIRAFKRKGTSGAFATGGESKWIREWTTNVEQFVEATVRSCGSPEWQLDVTYGLQLVKHIYSEHLLNKEHFLDWTITSFHNSDLNLLPSWFLVLQGHFDDITRQIPLGRRLVKAMLEQLYKISNVNIGELGNSISIELSIALRSLVLSNPSYFLMPDSWAKYESVLKACNERSDIRWTSRIKQIEVRNFRLIKNSGEALRHSGKNDRQRFIDLLDTSEAASDIRLLSRKSLDTLEDRALLVYTLLEWSTTPYRDGLPRIYIALRLLRLWNQTRLDLDSSVLQFLGQASRAAGVDRKVIYRLIAEMIRTGLFSVGKYLQWLIAGGLCVSCNEHAHAKSSDAFELELLNNIPLCDLPSHVLNLRRILMTDNRVPCLNDFDDEEAVKQSLGIQISILKNDCIQCQKGNMVTDLANLSGTIKYSISRWIRDRIGDECSGIKGTGSETLDDDFPRAPISLADFYALRDVLETLEDFPMLADVLILLSTSAQKPLLEAIAETVNHHIEVFRALGAAEDLFRRLLSRTQGIYTRNQSDKSILVSLVDIGENFPKRGAIVLKLMEEIGFCDPKTAVAACSPISDTMADALQSGDSNFLEEVEAMLSGGISLDKQTLHGIFSAISERLRIAWLDDDPLKCKFIELLAQLRSFNNGEFDCLMLVWLQQLVCLGAHPPLVSLISPLVCAGILDLQTFIQHFVSNLNDGVNNIDCYTLSLDIFSLFDRRSAGNDRGRSQRTHKYNKGLKDFLRTNPDTIVILFCRCFKASVADDAAIQDRARTLIMSSFCLRIIQEVVIRYRPAVSSLEQVFITDLGLCNLAHRMLDCLLCSIPSSIWAPAIISQDIRTLLRFANDFNVRLCQLKLNIMLDVPQDHIYDNDTFREECTRILVEEASSTFKSRPGIWLSFLSSLPQPNAEMFHAQCMLTLLATIPKCALKTSTSVTAPPTSVGSIDALLASIAAVEDRLPSMPSIDSIATITRNISQLQSYIQLGDREAGSPNEGVDHFRRVRRRAEQDNLFRWIDVLLRLLTIHQSIIRNTKLPQETLCQFLLSLSHLATTFNLKANSLHSSTVLDAIAFFSDFLSPESRSYCTAVLGDQQLLHDSPLKYLFVSADEEIDWLHTAGPSNTSTSLAQNTTLVPFPFRRWEMVQDATPTIGENDTSLSLAFFGTRKSVL
ncbi:RNA polymerase II mediator complex subunit [Xylographa pallens]|nr:RNA polymerase II mediator complex subunit [Xylographa pallens]